MALVQNRECPECGTDLPVAEGFASWCHQCGWNLKAPEREQAHGRLDRLYEAAGRRLGERLVGQMLAAEQLEPRLTPARLAAAAIAVAVYALTLALLVGGVALAVVAFPNPAALVASVIMVGTGFLMRPRPGKPPKEGIVTRAEAPLLYALVDEVASALQTRSADLIVIDHEYNAGWAVLGWRRRRFLKLGLPLLCALGPQERVALIAHELAHGRNGDSSRSFLVGSALEGLGELYLLVAPDDRGEVQGWELGGLDGILNAFFYVLSRPVYWLLLLQLHLLARDSQRAEYLADALAARVAGTAAVIPLHEKLLLDSTFRSVIQRGAQGGAAETDTFDELAAVFAAMPERERERRRRVARLEGASLGASHPPTAHRLRLLEGRPAAEAQVVLTEERSATVDAELSRHRKALQQELLEEYRDSLYYG
ncbi:MAG: M48 family metalloprotease [Gaiellaceae bacterium]